MKEVISTGAHPGAPYSDAIRANGFIFVAGQGPLDEQERPRTELSVEDQVRLTFRNVSKILEAAGASLSQVVQCRVFLADIGDFEKMNGVWREVFPKAPPARTTIEAKLTDGIAVEIDCIAVAAR